MSSDKDGSKKNQDEQIENEKTSAEGEQQPKEELDPLAQCQQELDKAQQDFLYLRAEFDNYKKQAIKERSNLIKYGGENIIRDLLDVLDNFERALNVEVTADNLDSFVKGMEMTATEMHNVLGRYGLRPVDSQGKAFDPMVHEALSSEETTEIPSGHVAREFKKAYKLHDKLIRPAQVVVAKEPSAPQDESQQESEK